MFVENNSLESVKKYFQKKLPENSISEVNLMVKYLTIKRLRIDESNYIIEQPFLFSESDLLFFKDSVKRLQNDEPFQYVLGEVEFYGLLLNIDSRALIPRPETEELVDWVVHSLENKDEVIVMDLCSGSGCIALGVKSVLSSVKVISSELSSDALALIDKNSEKTKLEIDIQQLDVLDENAFSAYPKNSFDCWVSNPPYIPMKDKVEMAVNVLEFEPEMALFVENDNPFIFYEKIAEQAVAYLREGGLLFFEIHEAYATDILSILKRLNFVNIELRKDLQGKDRMIKAQRLSSQNESE
tara:strand:- start:29692 stop:30585 length:894 start_codon:yes stop_codon:yes gene_type:complete